MGTNIVDGVCDSVPYPWPLVDYPETIYTDFDPLNANDATEYEVALANHDSGCGGFIQINGQWCLAGIGADVDSLGKSLFVPTDKNYFIRVSPYSCWINEVIRKAVEKDQADLNNDGSVDLCDIQRLSTDWLLQDCCCDNERDINGDGAVNLLDFAKFASVWQD